MAHHSATQSHGIDTQKEFQVLNSERHARGDNALRFKEQSSQSEINNAKAFAGNEPEGLEIAGFPWQFAFVIGVIALGVLGMILKLIGIF